MSRAYGRRKLYRPSGLIAMQVYSRPYTLGPVSEAQNLMHLVVPTAHDP
jgi:hypothetical protein